MRLPRSRLLLLIPALVAITAAVQAIAVNRASTLLPSSWTWANDPTFTWLLLAVTTVATVALVRVLSKAESGKALQADRRGLVIRPVFSFQTPMSVHKPPSTRIRWTPVLQLSYTGSRVLTVEDIIPLAPTRTATIESRDDEKFEVAFVRTKTSKYYKAYTTFGAMAKSQRRDPDDDFHLVEEWPLLLRPGQRLRITVEQEYEFRVDDSARSFDSDDDALAILGPYFDLPPRGGGGFGIRTVLLPTRIVCTDDTWEVDIPFLPMPAGVQLVLPTSEERAESVERDELS
ncbi:MAG TPA: hypothetical protein VGO66_12695 [Solirubrobacterales bacterium]|jgi:hypothetical protein|nr:hypothetical protein [Solirubrobacterales bacterium]